MFVQSLLVPLEGSKVAEHLANHQNIPLASLATLGDQPNDVLMFKQSSMSIAMGNASEAVQQQATHVTAFNEGEGFANAVERFILRRAAPAGTALSTQRQAKG
jgi:hydroxymethylpyrimidine pyrophosphatase-like HAD family hydrolase